MTSAAGLKNANKFVRLGLVGFGCAGAIASAHYVYTTYILDPPEKNEGFVQLAAITLSSTVVNKTLSDAEVHAELASFGLKVLTHPTTVAELKKFFIHEFTDPTPTRDNLKHFAVDELVQDRWVKEELLGVVDELVSGVREDPEIFPAGVLRWLGDCALAGLTSEQFKRDCKAHLLAAAWNAFLGPPPPGVTFL